MEEGDAEEASDHFDAGVDKMDEYQILNLIGEGKFSKVYKARRLSDGQIVALKKVQASFSLFFLCRNLFFVRFMI